MLILILSIINIVLLITLLIIIFRTARNRQDLKSYIVFHCGQFAGEDDAIYDTIVHEGMANEETYIISSGDLSNPGSADIPVITFYLKNIGNGETFQCVIRDILTIGKRGPNYQAKLQLEDSAVSKLHCRILVDGSTLYIQDMESTNHTYVNGEMITSMVRLVSGYQIKIGNSTYEIRY